MQALSCPCYNARVQYAPLKRLNDMIIGSASRYCENLRSSWRVFTTEISGAQFRFMALSNQHKAQVIKDYQRSAEDTGSPEVQVALLTERITDLSEHFKTHEKDHHSRQGLLKMINQRRKLLDYLKTTNPASYSELIGRLNLRK